MAVLNVPKKLGTNLILVMYKNAHATVLEHGEHGVNAQSRFAV
jgi:hypothetical protein